MSNNGSDKSNMIKAIVIGVLVFWVSSFVLGMMISVHEHQAEKNVYVTESVVG